MSDFSVVIFSWPPDALMLRRAVDGLFAVYGRKHVTISIDPKHKETFPCVMFADCIIRSDGIPGRGNLNGLTHMNAAAQLYLESMDAAGTEHVLKMDSDCQFRDGRLFSAHLETEGMTGFDRFGAGFVAGAAYFMSRANVLDVQRALADPLLISALVDGWQANRHPKYLPEDMAFHLLSLWSGRQVTILQGLHMPMAKPLRCDDTTAAIVLRPRGFCRDDLEKRIGYKVDDIVFELERLREIMTLEPTLRRS